MREAFLTCNDRTSLGSCRLLSKEHLPGEATGLYPHVRVQGDGRGAVVRGAGGVLLVETVRKTDRHQAVMITGCLCVLLGEIL